MNRIKKNIRWGLSRVYNRARRIGERLREPEGSAPDLKWRESPGEGLRGKTVVITGSTKGIGLAVAEAFLKEGARVVINGRDGEGVTRALREIMDGGSAGVIGVTADVSTVEGASRLVSEAVSAFGSVDILINNAGVSGPVKKNLCEIDPDEWEKVFSVNLTAAFLCSREAVRWMASNGVKGRVINVSTGAVSSPVPGLSPYTVSKTALEALTRTLALEIGTGSITCTAIELGSYRTAMSRPYFPWDEFELLPPPEAAAPYFLWAASADGPSVHGKVLAAWRLTQECAKAEAVINGPLSSIAKASFAEIRSGERVIKRSEAVALMDRAENARGTPSSVRSALLKSAGETNTALYPDENYVRLRQALSKKLSIPPDSFTFGNGSSELVERAVRTFTHPGDEALTTEPTWFMFERFCGTNGVGVKQVPYRQDKGGVGLSLDEMADAIGVRTRLIYIINPNNPIGYGIGEEDFRRFLERVPPHIPVVVDEAYIEYSTNPLTLRSNRVVSDTDRLVIGTRTFSKFYGLANLRIGYAFAGPEAMRLFNRLEPLFTLSSLDEAAAIAALGDGDYAKRTTDENESEKRRMGEAFRAAGLGHFESEMNFMLVESPAPPESIYRRFDEAGIYMPKGVFFGRYIVFPLGRPKDNDRNLEILLKY